MNTVFSYAPKASKAFNEEFHSGLEALVNNLDRHSDGNLLGVILCGGYGRGEGASITTVDGTELAWNDVDLVPVARNGRKKEVQAALLALEEPSLYFEKKFQAHLDWGRVVVEPDLQKLPPVLLWLETGRAHRILGGSPDLLSRNLFFDPTMQPGVYEARKLLVNRGAGLLMAYRAAQGVPPRGLDPSDTYFRTRNAMKAALALGDCLLMAFGAYETPLASKLPALSRVFPQHLNAEKPALTEWYRKAIDYKWEPGSIQKETTMAEFQEIIGLWLKVFFTVERAASGRSWTGGVEFSRAGGVLEPLEHRGIKKLLRNLVHNLRLGKISWKYPRERVLRRLPLLMEHSEEKTPEYVLRLDAFLSVWARYN